MEYPTPRSLLQAEQMAVSAMGTLSGVWWKGEVGEVGEVGDKEEGEGGSAREVTMER